MKRTLIMSDGDKLNKIKLAEFSKAGNLMQKY